jgi:hypothetical protein
MAHPKEPKGRSNTGGTAEIVRRLRSLQTCIWNIPTYGRCNRGYKITDPISGGFVVRTSRGECLCSIGRNRGQSPGERRS